MGWVRYIAVAAAVTTAAGCGEHAELSDGQSLAATTVAASPSSEPPAGGVPSPPQALERCGDVEVAATDVASTTMRTDIDPIFHGVILTYAAEHGEVFGGFWLDPEARGTVVIAFTDDPGPHREALAARRPSADDVAAVQPPPPIVDDRPIGEWGVAFDVVQVRYSEAELTVAADKVMEASRTVDSQIGGGVDILRNRVTIDTAAPLDRSDLAALTAAVADIDGVGVEMVCWSGQLAEEAPAPIDPGAALDPFALASADGSYPPHTPVTCDGVAFEFGDLAEPTPLADVDADLRTVLEDWLSGPEGQGWAAQEWYLLSADESAALFAHVGADAFATVSATAGRHGWVWAGAQSGEPCTLRLAYPTGVGEAEWVLDPSVPMPTASSTEIRVLVTERACASGQAMGERLLGPLVVTTEDAVRIAFGAIAPSGMQACPSNPPTAVTVPLDGPLGERELRDAAEIGPVTEWFGG